MQSDLNFGQSAVSLRKGSGLNLSAFNMKAGTVFCSLAR